MWSIQPNILYSDWQLFFRISAKVLSLFKGQGEWPSGAPADHAPFTELGTQQPPHLCLWEQAGLGSNSGDTVKRMLSQTVSLPGCGSCNCQDLSHGLYISDLSAMYRNAELLGLARLTEAIVQLQRGCVERENNLSISSLYWQHNTFFFSFLLWNTFLLICVIWMDNLTMKCSTGNTRGDFCSKQWSIRWREQSRACIITNLMMSLLLYNH